MIATQNSAQVSFRSKPTAVDLFCGAGGMSLGFEMAGFDVVGAVDIDPIHVTTHTMNFPECNTEQADLSTLSGYELGTLLQLEQSPDVIFGGPPCQSFSSGGIGNENDPRSELLVEFGEIVRDLQPRYFVLENVKGLLGSRGREALRRFRRMIEKDYSISDPPIVLDSSEFGVPQKRERVFLIGQRSDEQEPNHPEASNREPPTVWEAIGDLAVISDLEVLYDSDVFEGELGDPSDYAMGLRSTNGSGLTGCSLTRHSDSTIRIGGTKALFRWIRGCALVF